MTNRNRDKKNHQEVIGLIPAGGRAIRIAPLPCSKELYPIGFRQVEKDGSLRPKVICHYLLEKMRLAGITKSYIVLRDGKWDIPAYLGDGKMFNMSLAYLTMRLSFGVPYTIDQAYPFVKHAIVALGFPDILFQPDNVFLQSLNRRTETNADIVLALFPTDNPQKWDMIDLDEKGQIRQFVIKPSQTHLRYTWTTAVWTPIFTHFMHKYLVAIQKGTEGNNICSNTSEQPELFVGDVIQAAIHEGLRVEGVLFPRGTCLDIGTPEDLIKAVRKSHSEN